MASRNRTYVDGNTVRKYAAPEFEEEDRIRRQRKADKKKQHAIAQARANRTSRVYLAYMMVAVVAMVICFLGYVSVQAKTSATMSEIADLETQLSDLRADNLAATNRINSSANLNAVKESASANLGMVYATKDQIIYYSVDENDYIEQYDSVK